jgi:hypothetical protein
MISSRAGQGREHQKQLFRDTPIFSSVSKRDDQTDGAETVIRFCNDDLKYLDWIASHPDGFVLNVRRVADPDYVILHRARCRSISNDGQAPGAFTERNYQKSARPRRGNSNPPQNLRGGMTAPFRKYAVSVVDVEFRLLASSFWEGRTRARHLKGFRRSHVRYFQTSQVGGKI